MESFIEDYLNTSPDIMEQSDIEFCRSLLSDYIHQEQDYNRCNINQDLESRISTILMEVYIQQEIEYVSYHSKFIAESRKDLVGFQIPTKTHVVDCRVETDICVICQDDYKEGDCVGFLDCDHTFHWECIKNWLVVNNTCPLCKSVGVRYIG